MSNTQTLFTRKWELRTPTITRYLESEHVDNFFEKGELRISSFKAFREHHDEQRGDLFEGRASMSIDTPNGTHSIIGINGQEAYVLCGGTVENKNMESSFNTNDGFRIVNTIGFADTISRHIPGFISGMEGLCWYRDDLHIKKYDPKPIPPPDSYSSPEQWAEEFDRYVGQQTTEAFFIKHIKYAHQGEYRIIWFATGTEKPFIDILCPEARQFCQRLSNRW